MSAWAEDVHKRLGRAGTNEQYHLPRWFGCRRLVCIEPVGIALMSVVDTSYAAATDATEIRSGSFVDWPCALGGATLAAAISSLLLAFGSGLGLSLVSPWPAERLNSTVFGIIMIIWSVFVPLVAFALGGYFAGRLRRPWHSLSTEEVAFRDSAHGALVWATSIVIGAILLGLLASGASGLTQQPAMSRTVDDLFRSQNAPNENARVAREEAERLVGTTGAVTLSDLDQTYLASLVERSTGLPQAEATQRVTTVLQEARATAETARKAGIVAAFFTAVTLLMGLAVAWYAAKKGGEDRDKLTTRL
jgi:hypothetical protein